MAPQETINRVQPINSQSVMPIEPEMSDAETIDIQEYVDIFFRRRWLMLATVGIVFVSGLLYTVTRKPIYESTAKIVVSTSSAPKGGGSADDISLLSDLQALTQSRSIDTQVEIISSPDLIDEAYARLDTTVRSKGFASNNAPEWAYKVANKKNTDVISVTANAYTPEAAAELANSIANTFFIRDLKSNTQATHQARDYVAREMKDAERKLASANTDLAAYKRKTGLVSPDNQLAKMADDMAALQIERDSASTELASTQHEISSLETQMASQNESVDSSVTIARNPQFSAIVDTIGQLSNKRAEMMQEYTPASREVKQIDGEIQSAERRLRDATENIVASKTEARNPIRDTMLTSYSAKVAASAAAAAKVNAINGVMDTRKRVFLALPEQERQLSNLLQQAAIFSRTYDMLSTKYYALLINEQSALPNGKLVSHARVPVSPSYPQTKKNAMLFFMLGAMLSVGVAVIAERLDSRIHDLSLVERMTGLVSLGAIPETEHPDSERLLINKQHHNSAFLESFRILRNNIAFSAIDHQMKVIAVTSPGAAAGKTTTSINLAIALAMDGKKVIIVDCDLRRPSVHKWMGKPRDLGFTNVVKGLSTLDEAISTTEIENVSFLASGPLPPNPAEFLNSQHSRQIIRELAERYDLVIIDTPPAAGLSDVQVISTFVDGILMVITMSNTMKHYLQIAMRTLRQAGAPLIGFAVNRLEVKRQGYGYYYRYYYYDYDYTETADTTKKTKHRHRKKKDLAKRN